MGKYTKEEIDAIVERKRKARNREVFSEFIRIGESDLYDWEPTRRAVLMMIAFMQCNDEGAAAKVSEHSPFKGNYTGWCFASQKRLAFRIGCSERWVRDCIRRFQKDGVLKVRQRVDHMGYKHDEYSVDSEVVTAHQRGKAEEYLQQDRAHAPRKGGNKTANKGSFKKGNKAASHRKSQPLPQEESAESHGNGQPFAIGIRSRNPQEQTAVSHTADTAVKDDVIQEEAPFASLTTPTEGCFSSQSDTARDIATYAAERREERQGSVATSKSKSKPTGSHGSNGEESRPPIPNYLRYPSLFKDRVDRYGKWLGGRVPRCRKCDGNLQPNEHHICSGYEPKLPNNDFEYREAMRESMHQELMARREAMRDERLGGEWGLTLEDFSEDDLDKPSLDELEELGEQG